MGTYDGRLKEELRDLLRTRELPVSGNVEELIARLKDDDARQTAESDDDDLLKDIADPPPVHTEPPGGPAPAVGTPLEIEVPGRAPGTLTAMVTPEAARSMAADAGQSDQPPAPEPERPTSVEYRYPCPVEDFDTARHYEYLARALAQAYQEGHAVRGNGGVHRDRFENVDGVRHGVYRVSLRRQ